MATPRKTVKAKTLKHPAALEDWRDRLKSASVKFGFALTLSKAMLEYICAIADDCQWDRRLYASLHFPDNWIAPETSLIKRGLIQRKSAEEFERTKYDDIPIGQRSTCVLTPAGRCVVEILKMAGMFVECDSAINKRHRKA